MEHTKRELNPEELDKVTGGFVSLDAADPSLIKWTGICPICGEAIASIVTGQISGTCPSCSLFIDLLKPNQETDSTLGDEPNRVKQK